jgi:hypothetical protein
MGPVWGANVFRVWCGRDMFGGDIMSVMASTLLLCVEACGSWNLYTSLGLNGGAAVSASRSSRPSSSVTGSMGVIPSIAS